MSSTCPFLPATLALAQYLIAAEPRLNMLGYSVPMSYSYDTEYHI